MKEVKMLLHAMLLSRASQRLGKSLMQMSGSNAEEMFRP
jgi:hypothetical protein